MFLMRTSGNIIIVGGCDNLFGTNLWEKIILFACFLGSGLNCIFHWKAHWFIFSKSVYIKFCKIYFMSRTFEKTIDQQQKFYTLILFRQADHLYESEMKEILITDPCGTPELIFLHPDVWPFKTTLRSRFWRSFLSSESNLPSTLYDFNLKMRPWCQTLSNALEMSRKTPLINSRIIIKSCLYFMYYG